MSNNTTVSHTKGQKHPSKTKWEKVINKSTPPVIDEENPELVKDPKIKFYKPGNKKTNK